MSWKMLRIVIIKLFLLVVFCSDHQSFARERLDNNALSLRVDPSLKIGRKIPDTLFGVFFEEINHAGVGGLWAELVSNRGFEAGSIAPWGAVGEKQTLTISTDLTSCFKRNRVALKLEVLCNHCSEVGSGIYNPGFMGMNIVRGKKYKLIFYARSSTPAIITASLADASGSTILAEATISSAVNWKRYEVVLQATGTSDTGRLQLTAKKRATIWFDQVSLMPMDTFKGHGFRTDLAQMVAALKPAFIRFPGGCYVEGNVLKNAFRWKDTVVPWEERPGHYGDVWNYWSDDGLGFYEYLQLAEDLGATPIWVFNSGNSHKESVGPENLGPYVQDALDGLEFAMGQASSKWGSVRARMGHPNPFKIRFVGVGNEDCMLPHYKENFKIFYDTLKKAYPDIKLINNCDGSSTALQTPADYYDFHVYADASRLFDMAHEFDRALRLGPKAFVSEYAVTGSDANTGSLLAALGEAAFLIGLENNSDLVEMASYAPLFANVNDRTWNPDAIAYNSSHSYGTPSYYMQQFFSKSNGAILLHSTLDAGGRRFIVNTIQWNDGKTAFLRVKAVNFESYPVRLTIHLNGVTIGSKTATKTVLTSANVKDENSLNEPFKIVPVKTSFPVVPGQDTVVDYSRYSITAIDFVLGPVKHKHKRKVHV